MALPRPDLGLEPATECVCCKAAKFGSRYFVPWTEFGATGRQLCYDCLMTVWRIDTRREVERVRANRSPARGQLAIDN